MSTKSREFQIQLTADDLQLRREWFSVFDSSLVCCRGESSFGQNTGSIDRATHHFPNISSCLKKNRPLNLPSSVVRDTLEEIVTKHIGARHLVHEDKTADANY